MATYVTQIVETAQRLNGTGFTITNEWVGIIIISRSDSLVAIADLTDGVYKLRLQSPSYMLAAPAVTGRLSHRRLAHINRQDMNKMKNGIVDGLSYDDEERTQESLETPEVSVEQENSISVVETCVPEVDDQCDNSSDTSAYTDGEDTLHESPPSKVQVQEVQTTSFPESEHCVKAKRQRKQPERYGFSNLCVSSSIPASEEISISEALEGPEKEQWRRGMADELQSFKDNEAWELVKKPDDVSIVKCRWVFVKKYDVDNKASIQFICRRSTGNYWQRLPEIACQQYHQAAKDVVISPKILQYEVKCFK
ncbi:Retrovirus-related Pol polyprotein from transposon RE1; Endonuclease RE1 [Eumeta japonica]|uniref:Retrovirus-related Pol polyprotein from transposon RE1 Endonuclease RE1 n=1 Tax=Eumeta variegata TaxID=151549 RepID=A0A4C1SSP7_EUMVA|nr:Retrovirus-related Pol polyprotein from transposon RE1; Endonuclease RE1 [Eumeta japonica]